MQDYQHSDHRTTDGCLRGRGACPVPGTTCGMSEEVSKGAGEKETAAWGTRE